MKKFIAIVLFSVMILSVFSGCGSKTAPAIESVSAPESIELTGKSARYSGSGVVINGNVITINAEGDYHMTGTLDDGQIVINTGDTAGTVYLYLENVDLNCLSAPAIYVLQAEKLHIVLPEGTSNRIVSGTEANMANYDSSANGGAIFGEDDIDIEGAGSLEIFGYINNGITCKDDVKIEGGNISITCANNGIKGSESVTVEAGSLSINCGNDGLKSSSADKDGKGFVQIDGGNITINSVGDGISAETELIINGGTLSVTTSGNSLSESCKAIKSNSSLTISGGTLDLVSDDNAISTNEALIVSGGVITAVSTSRKGMHADEQVNITGGSISISAVEDGIQTKGDINISGGEISVRSEEDCIKAGEKGEGTVAAVGTVTISGGDLKLCAVGDPIEAKLAFNCSGGSIIGMGSPKNPQAPGSSSQSFISVSFRGKAGDVLTVFGEGVESSLEAAYDFTSVLFTSAELVSGSSYKLSTADSSANVNAK
ncbi:MAG: carbohydrate-binding domain-containing protein [Oscillospiraceae bacterium]|nr:carbohydrate-binding domain-containing protein [Oscillospiraceae bacterium]